MATITDIMKFKKGEIYSPDALELVPYTHIAMYFDADDEEINGDQKEYELGTVRCLKSIRVKVTIEIDEL